MKKLSLLFLLVQAFSFYHISSSEQTILDDATLRQIFLEEQISYNDIATLNKKCHDAGLALTFEYDAITQTRVARLHVRGLSLAIPQYLLEKIYNLLTHENDYNNKVAHVRVCDESTSMGYEEKKVIQQRLALCKKSIEKLLGTTLEPHQVPRIALCCSGGGCRAMLSTAGLLDGLAQEQLLDTFLYIAGLSGSTWAIGPWMLSHEKIETFFPQFINRIANGFTHTSFSSHLQDFKNALPTVADYLLKKLIFKEVPSVIDIYGYCLAQTLFDESLKKNYLCVDLADQHHFIKDGLKPFPLYSAVIPHDDGKNYSWLTFSPYEVTNLDFYTAVPTWSFGRKFSNGTSTTFAPPLTVGFLLGLFGSALSVSAEELANMFLSELQPQSIFGPLKDLITSTSVGDLRLFPAQIRNLTYKIPNFPLAHQKRTTIVDAGLDFNIPLPALLTNDRKVDIIIICDASANVLGAPELKKAEAWARANKIKFPKIDYTSITDKPYTIFDDGPRSPAPIVIYVPMVYNPNYSVIFDPQEMLGLGQFLNTLNFNYSKPQALTIAGLFEHAAHEMKKDFITTIKRAIARK